MKKLLICSFCVTVLGFLGASAQPTDGDGSKTTVPIGTRVFKVYNNPAKDKNEQFEIQAMGGTTFLAANTVDGTTNSYRHTLQINLSLVPVKTPALPAGANFQLVFYSESMNIQEAATYTDAGVLNIYYPISFYDGVRQKLEQAIAAKRKVYIKVVQKPNGYREGTLIL